jgi:hypothetical protein
MNTFKVLLKIGFTAILAFLLQIILPWWSIALASFLISLIISTKGLSSFISGFLGIAILWLVLASYVDVTTGSILGERIAALFTLPNSTSLIIVTSLIGGLVGGFAAVTGSTLRDWLFPAESY